MRAPIWLLLLAACSAEPAASDRALVLPGPTTTTAGGAGAEAAPTPVTPGQPSSENPGAPANVVNHDAAEPAVPAEAIAGVMDPTPAETPIDPALVLTENIVIPAVPPGGEATVCMTKRLSNVGQAKIVEVRAHISPGSHHFIVDRSPVDVDVPVLTPCVGLSGTDQSRLLIAEKPDTVFSMPPGVVFSLRPQQNLMMELHYINYTQEPLDVEGRIEMILAPESEWGELQEAGMVFTGNPGIALLPGTRATIEFFGAPAASAAAPAYVFAMTSHTHALGVRSWIERVPSAGATSGELVHESYDWEQPPMDEFDPPLVFTGTDGLRLRCDFNNTTDQLVTFGTRFQDEMCFMWLYYYPNTGALF